MFDFFQYAVGTGTQLGIGGIKKEIDTVEAIAALIEKTDADQFIPSVDFCLQSGAGGQVEVVEEIFRVGFFTEATLGMAAIKIIDLVGEIQRAKSNLQTAPFTQHPTLAPRGDKFAGPNPQGNALPAGLTFGAEKIKTEFAPAPGQQTGNFIGIDLSRQEIAVAFIQSRQIRAVRRFLNLLRLKYPHTCKSPFRLR